MPVQRNASEMIAVLMAANCTTTNATCTGIPDLSPQDAHKYIAKLCAANVPGFFCNDGDDGLDYDEYQMTPEQIADLLPEGVDPVPSNWPDPDAGLWGSSLPPDNIPPNWSSDWPDPSAYKPPDWDDYAWEQYQWNWDVYSSQYQPYRSSYNGFSINRRRRFRTSSYGSYSSNSEGRRSGYSSDHSSYSRRRSYSSRWSYSSSTSSRRRSYSSSYRSSYSSSYSRRRSYR
jgi:hypothetical protein